MTLPAGTRVRLRCSAWPERANCEGVVVEPPADGTYPQPSRWESIVKLHDDPLPGVHNWWSFVTSDASLETLA